MLTGRNSDVRFEGVTYHVQSEDRGAENPVLETLVYCNGQILHQERSGYADLLREGGSPAEVSERLDRQHKDLSRRVRHGEFARREPAAGEAAVGELPDLLQAWATADAEAELLVLEWKPGGGRAFSGCLIVTRAADGAPAAKVRVSARLVGRGLVPAEVLDGETDAAGELAVALALPRPASAVVFAAERGPGGGRLRVDAK
ncbi:MAG: hypothetical protein KBD01_05260 [Acidobacteria bacterium]|nr:hypothetical protein [Acidobacteriota bacterium]